jgi:GTP-binding protein EngB required for normal cell division
VAVLLTKADKLSRGAGLAVERQVAAALGPTPRVTRFSAPTHDGVEAARGWLDSWLGGK